MQEKQRASYDFFLLFVLLLYRIASFFISDDETNNTILTKCFIIKTNPNILGESIWKKSEPTYPDVNPETCRENASFDILS